MKAIIFGGSGFIGSHFSQYLLENGLVDEVVSADIMPIDPEKTSKKYRNYVDQGLVKYLQCDVRNKICIPGDSIKIIANFAAVHREPGHEKSEYYETNLLGAENVCNWAEDVGCNEIIFTSSIAPYGPSESERDESSTPVPTTAYGGSKLVAEKIHQIWHAKNELNRKLVIVRPGVVFGAGEGGNVTRLIKATVNRYFFYMGNKDTRKAGTYVKELCNAMWWALSEKARDKPILFNMSMNPGPTIEEYVDSVCTVANIKRNVPSVPYSILYLASLVIDPISKLMRINQPISPIRMKKLVRSNNIIPKYLESEGYLYKYTFEEALMDWRIEKKKDWK